jgi:hypothetical protein
MQSPGLEQYAMRAFAEALDSIPMALAENSGLSPIESLASIKSRQVTEKNSRLGVDCMQTGSNGECFFTLLPPFSSSYDLVPSPSLPLPTFVSLVPVKVINYCIRPRLRIRICMAFARFW